MSLVGKGRCVLLGFVAVSVARKAYHLRQFLRARATRSQDGEMATDTRGQGTTDGGAFEGDLNRSIWQSRCVLRGCVGWRRAACIPPGTGLLMLAPNASVARISCLCPLPLSSQTKNSLLLVPNASVTRTYCSSVMCYTSHGSHPGYVSRDMCREPSQHRFSVLVGVSSANSSDELSMPQLGRQVTTRGLRWKLPVDVVSTIFGRLSSALWVLYTGTNGLVASRCVPTIPVSNDTSYSTVCLSPSLWTPLQTMYETRVLRT